MTLRELYANIGADYDQAIRALRNDRLLGKHIRRFPMNDAVGHLITCRDTMDASELFESAHAVTGLCANLGLTRMSSAASAIAEQFRPENTRTMSDGEVKALIDEVEALYQTTSLGIMDYINS